MSVSLPRRSAYVLLGLEPPAARIWPLNGRCWHSGCEQAQNALTGNDKRLSVNTTIMTGNLQKVGAAMSLLLLRRDIPAKQARSSTMSLTVIVSTIFGAMVGALTLRIAAGGNWCFLPIACLQVRRHRQRRSAGLHCTPSAPLCCAVSQATSIALLLVERAPDEQRLAPRIAHGDSAAPQPTTTTHPKAIGPPAELEAQLGV